LGIVWLVGGGVVVWGGGVGGGGGWGGGGGARGSSSWLGTYRGATRYMASHLERDHIHLRVAHYLTVGSIIGPEGGFGVSPGKLLTLK